MANINPDLTLVDFKSLDYQVADNFNQERLITRLTGFSDCSRSFWLPWVCTALQPIPWRAVPAKSGCGWLLGANRRNVLVLVLRRALLLVGLGLAIGIPVALIAGRLMRSQLYGVRTYDPLTLGIAVLVLSFFAALAGFIPARRAASIEPMTALRIE